jgi:hypothetical protein
MATRYEARLALFEMIERNIAAHGLHVYAVCGGSQVPRYLYSIGLFPRFGFELVFAGAAIFSNSAGADLINEVAIELTSDKLGSDFETKFGKVRLRRADATWSTLLPLGANDFYHQKAIGLMQVVFAESSKLLDVPEMSMPWSIELPAWRYLSAPWAYPISYKSIAVTDVETLQGEPVLEIARWEDNQWEVFSRYGPDVDKQDVRIVPISYFLDRLDPALFFLEIGKGIWRDSRHSGWKSMSTSE